MRRTITGAILGVIAALLVIEGVWLYQHGKPETLIVENRTDSAIEVGFPLSERTSVAAQSSTKLSNGWFGPEHDFITVYLAEAGSCEWDVARKYQPMIVDSRGVHCRGTPGGSR